MMKIFRKMKTFLYIISTKIQSVHIAKDHKAEEDQEYPNHGHG